jgi:hypothetical protein
VIEDLLADMEAFLSQAVGLDGVPVAIMVAQISSIEQLRLELPSYGELLRSYGLGAPTEAHISGLETQLARRSQAPLLPTTSTQRLSVGWGCLCLKPRAT